MKHLNIEKIVISLIALLVMVGCEEKSQDISGNVPTDNTPTVVASPVSTTYVQIERLARPAINEGLIITNDFLNAFNSIPPSADFSPAAGPVREEALAVLGAVRQYALDTNVALGLNPPLAPPESLDVALGFLPDVMRIDTRNDVDIDKWAYNSDFVILDGTTAAAMLTGGRKIEDDVIDITLSYLIAGSTCTTAGDCPIVDGVYYDGRVGNDGGTDCASAGQGTNVAAPGHKCLEGQSNRKGSARFPFLASPN